MNSGNTPMDIWHQCTLRANTEFQLACYGNAILLHNQALDHARHQFATPACCIDHALARVLISNFSLADCYAALGEIERAADCYLAAQRFLGSAQEALADMADATQAVQQANAHLHALWLDFVRAHQDTIPYQQQLAYHAGCSELLGVIAAQAVRH